MPQWMLNRNSSLVACLLLVMLCSGCFFGRSKDAKTAAYVLNGVAIGLGGILYVTGEDSTEPCFDGGTCTSNDGELGGSILMIGGAVGLVINLLTSTTPSAPAPASAPAPSPGQ